MGLTTREPKQSFEEMINAIRNSLPNHASSHNEEAGDNEDDDDTEMGKLSDNDKPSWLVATITKSVQLHIERFRQKQMKLDGLTLPGGVDAANYFGDRDKKHGTTELKIPPFVKPQIDNVAAAPAPTTFGELICCLIWSAEQCKCRNGLLDLDAVL